MTQMFGGNLSETPSGFAIEVGYTTPHIHGSVELLHPTRSGGADDDHDWESAWIDLGGEG